MGFVKWCNENSGFITAVFSLLSLLISTIAIIISVLTARLPFKKALRISGGSYFGVGSGQEDKQGIYVNALNVGNVPINIVELGLWHNNKQILNVHTIKEARGILTQMSSVEQEFCSESLREAFRGKTGKVYAFAKDAEGKIYKKYLCHVRDF